jgi:hypothetical protein
MVTTALVVVMVTLGDEVVDSRVVEVVDLVEAAAVASGVVVAVAVGLVAVFEAADSNAYPYF